jgi:hypothetical protein
VLAWLCGASGVVTESHVHPSEDYAHDNYEDLKDFIVDEEPAAPARAADRAPVTLSMSRMPQPFNHMARGQDSTCRSG